MEDYTIYGVAMRTSKDGRYQDKAVIKCISKAQSVEVRDRLMSVDNLWVVRVKQFVDCFGKLVWLDCEVEH